MLNGDDGLLETKPTNERLEKIGALQKSEDGFTVAVSNKIAFAS